MSDGVDVVDTGSLPMTEPHHAPIFDTGPHPQPLGYAFDDADSEPLRGLGEPRHVDLDAAIAAVHMPMVIPATAAPGRSAFVKRWQLAATLVAMWCAGAASGFGMFYWWFHTPDKTWVEFATLLFVVICVVAGLLIAMVEDRPVLSAAALGAVSAPCAAGCGAAVLYGAYVFSWISP